MWHSRIHAYTVPVNLVSERLHGMACHIKMGRTPKAVNEEEAHFYRAHSSKKSSHTLRSRKSRAQVRVLRVIENSRHILVLIASHTENVLKKREIVRW